MNVQLYATVDVHNATFVGEIQIIFESDHISISIARLLN